MFSFIFFFLRLWKKIPQLVDRNFSNEKIIFNDKFHSNSKIIFSIDYQWFIWWTRLEKTSENSLENAKKNSFILLLLITGSIFFSHSILHFHLFLCVQKYLIRFVGSIFKGLAIESNRWVCLISIMKMIGQTTTQLLVELLQFVE